MGSYAKLSRLRIISMACLAALSLVSECWSGTYFVSSHQIGSDANPGTQSAPWRTISKAADSLRSGDTVIVQEGIYRELVIPRNSGTSENPIVYQADPGKNVIIAGSDVVSSWRLSSGSIYSSQITWITNQVFQDGQRLQRVVSPADLIAGSWYQDSTSMALYIVTDDNTEPSQHLIEAARREHGIYLYQKSSITVDGFTVRQTNGRGAIYLGTNSTGNQVRSINVSYSYGTGILLEDGASNNLLTNNKVSYSHYSQGNYQFHESNGIMLWYGSNSNTVSINELFSNYGSGIFISNTSNNAIDGNTIHDNGAGGIDVNDPQSNNNLVAKNVIFRNGLIGTGEQGISFFQSGSGNIARGNIVSEQKGGPNDGSGIALDYTANRVIVENNIVFNNSGHGLIIWNSKNGVLRNNTLHGNFKNGIFVGGKDSSGVQIVNNIASNNATNALSFQPDAVAAGGHLISHNEFFKTTIQRIIQFNDRVYSAAEFNAAFPGSDLFQFDPMFVSPLSDFNLSAASPCIDKGIDVGLPFTGSAPDLGALEHTGASHAPAAPIGLRVLR